MAAACAAALPLVSLLLLLLRLAPCHAAESNHTPGAGPCYKQETYNATVEMMVTVQVNKTKYDWCLGGFMRCQIYKLENVDRLENITQVHTRNIETCCPGTEPTRPPVPGKNVSLNCVPIRPPTTSTTTTTTTTTTTMPTTTTTQLPTTRPTMPPPTKPKSTTLRTTPTTTSTTTTTPAPTIATSITTSIPIFTTPRETCRPGLWGRACPHECNCGAGWPCDQETGACPPGAPGPTTPATPPTTSTQPTVPTTAHASRAATVGDAARDDGPVGPAGPGAGPGGGSGGMREVDDVPLHIALALLCIALLAVAVAAISRRRIARFMNKDDDGWESDNAVRCTVAGEDAKTSGTPLGLMWGEYDTPPSPVVVANGVIRDPLAEHLAARTSHPEHIYQEIRPHQNGGPIAVALRGRSEAFQ